VNQLVSVTAGSTNLQYSHDGLGRLAAAIKTVSGVQVQSESHVWDDGTLAEERGDLTRQLFSNAEYVGGASYFEVSDHLASISAVTNGAGSVTESKSYDPFGRVTQVIGSPIVRRGYAATLRSDSQDLNLTLYRPYDADIGRWLTTDPLIRQMALIGAHAAVGTNGYRYANSNPIVHNDPTGLFVGPAVVVICVVRVLAVALVAALAHNVIMKECEPCRANAARRERCYEQYQEDYARCSTFGSRQMRAQCYANAADRYADCLGGRPPRPYYPVH
jgi:RHS repeat-associated protein